MSGNAPIVAMLLTADEVDYLTGIGRGRDGKTKHELQYVQLKAMAVSFRINARGMPIITHSAVETNGQSKVESSPKPELWKSNAR